MLAEASRESGWLIVVGAAASIAGLLLWIQQWLRQTRHHQRGRRGRRGERKAHALLKRRGYAIIEEQVHRAWQLNVDGNPLNASSRADFLVSYGKRRFIAEVKTGKRAANPLFPATRRQLLEYAHVYRDVDGLLLVDVENSCIVEVSFPAES